ncbi:TrbI/VirB10 family protein [Emcibacter nanhaiensis]|uniref:TrbI/VirB10 family protein n=1 Tax=Emcibacter nanhaiensis TaxID=1505037 RepID=A0A501PFV0_9PROT|nr:TrbI/VirB10 family protein [Emcibacter nanhaiensis]TPD59303.1 TrbI/VirB10 family protein [Emcibacter nanhaiensis]
MTSFEKDEGEREAEKIEKKFQLRAKPKPVRRLNKKLIVTVVCLACSGMLAISFYALDPGGASEKSPRKELYSVGRHAPMETVSGLPASYQDVPKNLERNLGSNLEQQSDNVVALGPAYMGDTGPALLRAESDLGTNRPEQNDRSQPFRPSVFEEQQRAEKLQAAQLERQARNSVVFFSIDNSSSKRRGFADAKGSNNSPPYSPLGVDKAEATGRPAETFNLLAGTIISGSLLTGINSDLKGQVVAQITEPVYDTVTGQEVLIPQGARILGKYVNEIEYGQDRVLIVWDRIICPDGASVQLDGMPGTDKGGYSGLSDQVDWHTDRLVAGVGLATLLGVGTELAYGDAEGELARAIRESSQSSLNNAGQRIVDRNLNIPPTITVRAGWPIRIIVTRDLKVDLLAVSE